MPARQHELGHRPDQRVDAVGRAAAGQARRRRSRTSRPPARGSAPACRTRPCCVEHRHRLGPQSICPGAHAPPAPGRSGRSARITAVDHVAALVHFGHDAVGLRAPWNSAAAAPAQSCGRAAFTWHRPARYATPSPSSPGGDDAAGVGAAAARAGGSTATTMRRSSGTSRHARASIRRARPQRVVAVLDQFAVEFLPAEPRAAIALAPAVEERRRQIGGVGARRQPASPTVPDRPISRFTSADRPRRRGHIWRGARRAAGRTAACPRSRRAAATLPVRRTRRHRELRAAQSSRGPRREELRHRAVGPDARPLRRLEERARAGGWTARMPETPSTITSRTSAKRLADQRDA